MSSPDQRNEVFRSPSITMGSPPIEAMETPEYASEEMPEKPYVSPSSSRSSQANSPQLAVAEDTPQSPCSEKDLQKVQEQKEQKSLKPGTSLVEYPFVLKLFLAASNASSSMLNWSEDGLELEVDYVELQNHLTGGRSIFHCLSVKQFSDELQKQGFTRIFKKEAEAEASLKPILLYFEHSEFARGELGSLQKLMKNNLHLKERYPMGKHLNAKAEEAEDENAAEMLQFRVPLHLPSQGHLSRMQQRGDACCSTAISTVRPPLLVARCRFRTLLYHLATTNKLLASSRLLRNNSLRNPRPWDVPTIVKDSFKFVKPHDSVITLDADKPPDYAGYYGKVDATKVELFFSEYLPRYGNKTTGYKDVVLEATHKTSNFQQNLPIGLADSEGEDNELDDVQSPVSPAGGDSDLDCMPSTSSAAAAMRASAGRKREAESADDEDLEEAMQELCGGSTVPKENDSSGSRGKAKAPQPKTPIATSRKRPSQAVESSSSDTEAPVSKKRKKSKKEKSHTKCRKRHHHRENREESKDRDLPVSRGRSRAHRSKTPKDTPRKRHYSCSEDEEIPQKKAKKGVQDSEKKKQVEESEDEEETLLKSNPEKKMKQLQDAEEYEEEADTDGQEMQYEEEDEVDYAKEEDDNAKEGETAEEGEIVEEEDKAEDESGDDNEVETEVVEADEDVQDEDAQDEDVQDEASEGEAAEDEDAEDEEADEDEYEDEDEDEEAEYNEEDDDDDDYNVQYKAPLPEPETPRRYELRNTKRQSR